MKSDVQFFRIVASSFVGGVFLTLCLVGCGKSDVVSSSEDEPNIDIEGNELVEIEPDRSLILHNPFTEWVTYASIGDGASTTYWSDYDNMHTSEGSVVKVSDYSNTLYLRGAWADFNPEDGVYAWEDECTTQASKRLKGFMEEAEKRGMKLAFTFVVDSRDKHDNFTPAFVKDAGAKGYETVTGSATVWSPYPDDPIFQKYYEKFIYALGERFDDPDKVQFISGTGLGKWGEYHTVWYYGTKVEGKEELPIRESVFDWATSLYADAFKRVPLLINFHRWIGTGRDWVNESTYDEDTERLIGKAVEKGYSLRHDAFGMHPYYGNWEREFAQKWFYKRPIIMEGGWVVGTHRYWTDSEGKYREGHPEDVRNGEFKDAQEAHVNMMDFRIENETETWFGKSFDLVKRFVQEGGYRLYPSKVSLPTTMENNTSVTLVHYWKNIGWGYCPTNMPQWKNKYKVAFALLDTKTENVKFMFVDDKPEACDWILGNEKEYIFNTKIENIPTGNYTWAIGIIDMEKEDPTIGIKLSVSKNVTSKGWLKLRDVIVK